MFCEADAAAQGIFTGELRLTEGSCTSNSKVPRAQRQQPIGALTTDMSPSFPIIFFLQRNTPSSVLLGAFAFGVLQEFP